MGKYRKQRVPQQIRAAFSLSSCPVLLCQPVTHWILPGRLNHRPGSLSDSNVWVIAAVSQEINLLLIAAQMGKEFCHSWLCWRCASGVPNLCDLYVAVESPCFILLSSEFTIGTVFCISKDFRFYWDCIWCRMCLMSRFVWEGHPSSFVHAELRLVGDGIPFQGRRNWCEHLQSSLCFLCPAELQQRLPGQRGASLDAQFQEGRAGGDTGGQGCSSWGLRASFHGDCQEEVAPPSLLQERKSSSLERAQGLLLCVVSHFSPWDFLALMLLQPRFHWGSAVTKSPVGEDGWSDRG